MMNALTISTAMLAACVGASDGFDCFGGLGALPFLTGAKTRSISAENPTGEKGKAGMAVPDLADPNVPHAKWSTDLGQGWKVRPFLAPKAGETVTLMDVDGPGMIQHIWIVVDWEKQARGGVLRFYWDNETTPSVETPIADFFAVGHGIFAPVNSLAVVTNPGNALNCFWPMPFRKHVKVTFTNETDKDMFLLAYQIDYVETEVPANAAYLHAQYRRSSGDKQNPYVILDGVKGNGRYVGTFMAVTQEKDGWWGEGEIKFFIDGDQDFPTICGTGTEDYFLCSFGFPAVVNTPYVGVPLKHGTLPDKADGQAGAKWSLYRWHIMDPINFDQDLKVTIQDLGWGTDKKFLKLGDDFSSVAYWYQTEPHASFPTLPPTAERIREPFSE